MRDFERKKGYANSADETAKVIAAYHDIVRRSKNNFNEDYNAAFKRIDGAIQSLAKQILRL